MSSDEVSLPQTEWPGPVFVSLLPGRRGGEPCISNTRIPSEQAAGLAYHHGIGEVLNSFPGLGRGHALVACWYHALHGSKRWRKRWKGWAKQYESELWRSRWDDVPDPPTITEPASGGTTE